MNHFTFSRAIPQLLYRKSRPYPRTCPVRYLSLSTSACARAAAPPLYSVPRTASRICLVAQGRVPGSAPIILNYYRDNRYYRSGMSIEWDDNAAKTSSATTAPSFPFFLFSLFDLAGKPRAPLILG